LVVEGRKIAGSAQVRQKGVVLQHGSILLEMDIDLLFEVLRFTSERVRDRLRSSFADKAVAINDVMRAIGRPEVTITDAVRAFQAGIAEGLGIQLELGELTQEERKLSDRLVRDKYGNDAWNFRR